jgi:hypothetical protein
MQMKLITSCSLSISSSKKGIRHENCKEVDNKRKMLVRMYGLRKYKGNVQQGFEELTNGFICGQFYNRKGMGHQICANSPEVFAQVG